MTFYERPLGRYGRAVHIGHDLHRVGIAHGKGADFDSAAIERKLIYERPRRRLKGNLCGLEFWHAHVYRYLSVRLNPRSDYAAQSPHADLILRREPALADVLQEAPCPVTALFDLPPIRVEDPVMEIGTRQPGRLDLKDLVATYPEAAVREQTKLRRAKFEGSGKGVQHYEVVAQALHLSKLYTHL